MEIFQVLGRKQVQCSNRNCLNRSTWIPPTFLIPVKPLHPTKLCYLVPQLHHRLIPHNTIPGELQEDHLTACMSSSDSNLGMLLTFEVDWQCLSKEYCLSLSHLHLLPLPETWNQKRHSEQTVQTWLHPGRKNPGGPESLDHPPGTLPSGCTQLSGQLALPVGIQ